MNIAVNTRFLLKDKLEGIGWFTYETMKRITRQHSEHRFYFFFDRPYDEEFIFSDNIKPIVLWPQARHPLLFYLWFEYAVANKLKAIKADLFLSPDGFLSLKTHVKTLLVIHDLAFEHYPQNLGWLTRKYMRTFSPLFAKKADRIATVSGFSKNDIHRLYGIPLDHIDVVNNGANENYHPYPPNEVDVTKTKFHLNPEYFIYAGAIHPRKNVVNLFRAFDAFKKQNECDVQLAIAGRKAWKYEETMKAYEQMAYKDDVKFLGHLPTDELARLMSGALAMVYVSKFEGFGIPLIEAMNCDTPVITSNVSSMPEVAGDAALLVAPESVAEIALALERIYKDESLRKILVEKGKIQREKFSWDRTSRLLWKSVEKLSIEKKEENGD